MMSLYKSVPKYLAIEILEAAASNVSVITIAPVSCILTKIVLTILAFYSAVSP